MESLHIVDDPCPLGCKRNDEIVLTGKDLIHELPGDFTIVKCCTCGLMRTNPRPTPESIGFYYPDDYGPYQGTQVRLSKRTSGLYKLVKSLAKRVVDFKSKTLPPLPPGRMLEIGCASGSFLHHMANQGWQVQGVELSELAARSASQHGYCVHAGPLETAPVPDAPFDLFVGWMVLEHLYDPIGGLRRLREWAKPGAWLVLSVPNMGSLEFSLFKDKWHALHLPNHLYHFTPQTLAMVLQAGGWKLEKVHHQRNISSIIISIGYILQDKGYAKLGRKLADFSKWGAKLSYALFPLGWLLSFFGQTGRMTVWARVNDKSATGNTHA